MIEFRSFMKLFLLISLLCFLKFLFKLWLNNKLLLRSLIHSVSFAYQGWKLNKAIAAWDAKNVWWFRVIYVPSAMVLRLRLLKLFLVSLVFEAQLKRIWPVFYSATDTKKNDSLGSDFLLPLDGRIDYSLIPSHPVKSSSTDHHTKWEIHLSSLTCIDGQAWAVHAS